MRHIFDQCSSLFDSAKQIVLDRVASTCRSTRERAVNTLTKTLDPTSENGKEVFQTLPLEFIQRGDVIGAIWYTETIGKIGNMISPEVIQEVILSAIEDRRECMEGGDEESLKDIDSSIRSLFRMIETHSELRENSDLFISIGEYEESRGNPYQAIPYYDKAIEQHNIRGYLASAKVYEELGEHHMSEAVLDVGSMVHRDTRILGLLIRILYRQGKSREAYVKYLELKNQDEGTLPFIVYKGKIENDGELRELENIIASYITEASFIPFEALAELSRGASSYILEQVDPMNDRILELDKKSVESWSDEEYREYNDSIFRRLSLMQVDVLTLCNPRYIEYYLGDLRRLGIDGSPMMKSLIRDFFSASSSEEVTQKVHVRDKIESTNDESIKSSLPNTVYEDISLHVERIGALFSQPGFYDVQSEYIAPIIELSATFEGKFDEEIEGGIHYALRDLKEQEDYYYGLNPSVRKNHERFLQAIDQKYGVFYRRHIQTLAMDISISPEKYPNALRDYPDIALLFWMEKMIAGQFLIQDPEEIERIVQDYSLHHTNILNALLFGSLIFDISIEYSLLFLVDYPNMLDVPEAIYIITEGLRSMNKKSREMVIKDFHILAKEGYRARGFFDHIRCTFDDIYKNDPSDEDIEFMLLSSGNIAVLQNKERTQAILNFQTAGEEFSSVEGLMRAGDSYEDIGDYDRALDLFERALSQDDTITTITRVLNVTISSGRFKKAEQYIQYALSKGYSIANYVLAFHLWQGNTKLAFLQVIHMIKKRQTIINMPKGLTRLLFDTLSYVIDMPDSLDRETDIHQIYASFIFCSITPDGFSTELEAFTFHWQHINNLSDSYDGEALHSIIRESLQPMTGVLDDIDQRSASDESLEYLDTQAQNIYHTYEVFLSETDDAKRKLSIKKLMNDLCGLVILTLQKFPDSEEYVANWRSKLRFNTYVDSADSTYAIEYTMTCQ